MGTLKQSNFKMPSIQFETMKKQSFFSVSPNVHQIQLSSPTAIFCQLNGRIYKHNF